MNGEWGMELSRHHPGIAIYHWCSKGSEIVYSIESDLTIEKIFSIQCKNCKRSIPALQAMKYATEFCKQ